MTGRDGAISPQVSVIMPARDVAEFIAPAVRSVLGQTLQALEILVVDDGSVDGTVEEVVRLAAQDRRVRLLQGGGAGPGAARNRALSASAAPWAAIIDADDLVAPDRLERLLTLAEERKVELAADNLTAFYADGSAEHLWLSAPEWRAERDIDLETFLASGVDGAASGQLGYLKPLVRLEFIRRRNLHYDESLYVGEDYDFVLQMLAHGARYVFSPISGYRYRRHSGSVSHRISEKRLQQMSASLSARRGQLSDDMKPLLDRRLAGLEDDLRFVRLVDAIKAGNAASALPELRSAEMRRRLIRAAGEGMSARLRCLAR